jgi:drug/metabolite transporter (DMT)-like permease
MPAESSQPTVGVEENAVVNERGGLGLATPLNFVLVVLIGGGNFVAVRISNQELEPFWGAGLRFGLAAVGFVVFALVARLTWPRGRALALTALYGVFSFALSYALMYWALTRVSAGLAAVLLAAVPLVTQFLAAAHGMERLSRRNLVGAVVAIAGIVLMTIGPAGVEIPLSGLIAIAVAALTVGESVIIGKKVSVAHPAMTNAVGMPIGALGLLAISAVAGETWAWPGQSDVLWSVIYLTLIGSIGLFVLFLLVMRRWTPSASSYAFVLFPVVTLILEATLLGEPLIARSVAGALVVMAGVWFGALSPDRRRGAPSARVGAEPREG